MLRCVLGFVMVMAAGCGGRALRGAEATSPRGVVGRAPLPATEGNLPDKVSAAGALDEPAEPFSASWLESGEGEARPEAWINADACPDSLVVEGDPDLAPYRAFIERELRDGSVGALAWMQIQPSFSAARSLSVRRSHGSYQLRSIELTSDVWAQMMQEMRVQQGDSARLDAASLDAALAHVTTSKVVHERRIDAKSALLIAELWRSLTARAQVVQEINGATGKGDGTRYEIHVGKGAATTHSPQYGSVLGDMVAATEHLEAFVDGPPNDSSSELEMARDLILSALERTRQGAPCLKRLEQ